MWKIFAVIFGSAAWAGAAGYKKGEKIEDEEKKKRATKTCVPLQEYYLKQAQKIVQKDAGELKLKGMNEEEIKEALYAKYDIPTPAILGDTFMKHTLREYTLNELAVMITRRHMAELGYKYSYDGKESKWQESEKLLGEIHRINNRYRWL